MVTAKRFLTMFWYEDVSEAHLYKDVGGIPYALARYAGWKTTFAYADFNGEIHNKDFEKYVKLESIKHSSWRYIQRIRLIKYVWQHALEYDVINFYHGNKNTKILAHTAKLRNPNIKVYMKLDLGEDKFNDIMSGRVSIDLNYVDLFTVETKYFYDELKKLEFTNGGVIRYLPNGVSPIEIDTERLDKVEKENIVITVGRLGTYQKNTELLLEGIAKVDFKIIQEHNWKFYLVGTVEPQFEKYVDEFFEIHPQLKDYIIFTGPIYDRNALYALLAKSKIMCMTSRFEGFSLAIIEGTYFGCYPVLTNYNKGVLDITCNGELGSIANNENVDDFSNKLLICLKNKDALDDLCPLCRDGARRKFGYDALAKMLDRYLAEIN